MRKSQLAVLTAMVLAALSLAACGGGSSDSGSSGDTSGSGKIDGEGKSLVFFTLTRSANVYVAAADERVEEQAEKLGFDLKVIETTFDQAVQNEQAQQFIASGQEVDAVLWWPFTQESGYNSTRLLSRVAPVFQFNQEPYEKYDDYITAYAGQSDFLVGKVAGENAVKARDKAREEGVKLHSEGGNLVYFGPPAGIRPGIARLEGFEEAAKAEPFNLLGEEPSLANAEDSYKVALQSLPKYKDEGIDFIFAFTNDGGNGVLKALKQNGYTPGKDVQVITGNCSGDLQAVRDGETFGTGIQSALVEADILVRTVAQYLATGEVKEGKTTLPESPQGEPPLKVEAPYKFNYLPTPGVAGAKELNSVKLWGYGVDELCPS